MQRSSLHHFMKEGRMPETMQKFGTATSMLVALLLSALLIVLLSRKEKALHCMPVSFQGIGGVTEDVGDVRDIRYYNQYTLTGDSLRNSVELMKMRRELNDIKNARDTRNGIEIHIDGDTPFQDYITCLDICREKKPVAFVCCGNEVYAMYVGISGPTELSAIIP